MRLRGPAWPSGDVRVVCGLADAGALRIDPGGFLDRLDGSAPHAALGGVRVQPDGLRAVRPETPGRVAGPVLDDPSAAGEDGGLRLSVGEFHGHVVRFHVVVDSDEPDAVR